MSTSEDYLEIFRALGDFADNLNDGRSTDRRTRRELRRLNDNLEDLLDSMDEGGHFDSRDAFLDEFEELERQFEEKSLPGTNTKRKMQAAEEAARRVRIRGEVTEDQIEKLDDLRDSMTSGVF
jgi:hypothetical protein